MVALKLIWQVNVFILLRFHRFLSCSIFVKQCNGFYLVGSKNLVPILYFDNGQVGGLTSCEIKVEAHTWALYGYNNQFF